jgi:hypothetical protein
MKNAKITIYKGDFTAESAHRLCELQPDVPGPKNDQVFGHDIEFKGLDVGQWLC